MVGFGLWWAVGGTEGATSPWAVLLVRARAGLKPAPTSASSGSGVEAGASLRVPRWGLACGGRLVGPRGATSPWAVLLVRARAGLKPAPTSDSSGRGGGVRTSLRVPRWGLACGGRLVGPRGATWPWAVLLVRARAGLTRPYVCLFGTRWGGSGLLAGSTGGIGLWWAVGGTEGGDFALGCSAGAGAGGFETRPYVCLFGTRRGGPGLLRVPLVGFGLWWAVGGTEGATSSWAVLLVRARAGLKPAPTSDSSGRGVGGRASCGFHCGVWLVVGGWWDRGGRLRLGLSCWCGRGRVLNPPLRLPLRDAVGGPGLLAGSTVGIGLWWAVAGTEGATSPWAVLLVRARAGFKPAPTSASSGRGVGGRASCGFHGGVWLVVGGWWDRGATSPWAVLLVRARAGLKPAPTSASSGRGGGVRPPCGFDGGDWLVVGGWWDRGATSSWAVLLVRARAGLKPAPTSASSGSGVEAGASLRVPRWGLACGGRLLGPRGGDFALGCPAGAGAGGFETRPYVCLFGTRWGGRASLRVRRGGLACGGRLVGPRGATSPWAVLLVRARAGLKPAPTSASSGRGVGGPGLLAGSTVGFGLWWAVGGTEGGDFALGCSAGAGAGGFETRPYVCLFGTRCGGPGLLAGSTVEIRGGRAFLRGQRRFRRVRTRCV